MKGYFGLFPLSEDLTEMNLMRRIAFFSFIFAKKTIRQKQHNKKKPEHHFARVYLDLV